MKRYIDQMLAWGNFIAEAKNVVALDDGEFVARWRKCSACTHRESIERMTGHCPPTLCFKCEGTGRVAVPVEPAL